MADTLGMQAIGGLEPGNLGADLPRADRSDLSSARVVGSLVAAMLVGVLTVAAVELSRGTGAVAAVWPASGVAVVGWLKGPRNSRFDAAYVLFVAAAYTIAGILVGNPLAKSLILTFACVLEAALTVYLIRRFTTQFDLSTLKGVIRFLLFLPAIATLPSALLAGGVLQMTTGANFVTVAETWWFGHALGIAVVTPFGLALTSDRLAIYKNPLRALEAVAILAAIAAVDEVVFFQRSMPIAFLITPLLLLAAVRHRMLGAAASVLLVSTAAILGLLSTPTTHIVGISMLADKVRMMQLYCIFGCLTTLPIAALLDERDRLADAAQQGQLKAEAASAGKSRLLANVSHEIKSPVAGIIGIGELWQAGKLGPVSSTQEEMAAMLVRTARQVEALAYDLLDVSHAEAGTVAVKLQPVDLEAVAEDVRRSVAVKPEAQGIDWQVEGRGEKLTALADSVRVVQIVTNLVTNAVKYGASGKVIKLKLSRPAVDRVRLEVEDHGPGIPHAKQSELFEPFNRLGMEKTATEGHGIGLALARRLAELQGGLIGFESAPGHGSRFWLELPAVKK
ncbi:MAG TPA: ATP-binding protein [Caulobacteraceae bacterium]|jgi:signal transduction histidine kinase|nr:ATP-binding protein [Caulobacteraceae bacterium]